MKANSLTKFAILFLATTLASACGMPETTIGSNSQTKDPSTSSSSSSSGESKSSSSGKSSSNISSSSSSSGGEDTPAIPSSCGVNPILKEYTLQSDNKTCDNHQPKEEIVWKASIVSKGVKRFKCPNCGGFTEQYYYDLDEVAFEDKTFAYDGNERTLTIEGIIPHDVTVRYTNNKLTEQGSQEAKAEFYNKENEKIGEKTANLSIVPNTGLPNLRINTTSGQDPDRKEKVNYTEMTASVDNCDSKWAVSNLSGGIRIRGNSTKQASVNKLAWRLKFDEKVNILGLHGGKKNQGYKSWVILADNFDYSYFRNMTAFNFGNSLFNYSGNYASRYQHVNVYMNGRYDGIYLLAEQQQSNSGRFSITESEGDTGVKTGYLVEIDGLVLQGKGDGDYTFKTSGSSKVGNVTIQQKGYVVKTDVFGDEQGPFIEKYVKNLQKVFISACNNESLQVLNSDGDIVDSPFETQYETLNSIFDLDSFFRMYVLQEFMKNYDCGWGSFYLFIDFSEGAAHPRFTSGGPWDFDLGLGNKKSDGHYKPDGDFLASQSTGSGGFSMGTEFNPWLFLLSQTDFFSELFERYYNAFANSGILEQAIEDIDYETSAFATDFANEYTRWGGDSGRTSMGTYTNYSNHQAAVTYLTDWLSQRKTYLDNKYLK